MSAAPTTAAAAVPDGFTPLKHGGPYLRDIGPWYYRHDAQGQIVLALRVEQRHTNIRHVAHGGLLVTMCDSALGIVLPSTRQPPQPMVTVSLNTDFIASALPGDWLEAHVVVTRVGGRMAYGTCRLMAGERCVMTASGVFALMKPIAPTETSEG